MPAVNTKEQVVTVWDVSRIQQLEKEIAEVETIRSGIREMVAKFLMEQDIWHISDIDYLVRKRFEYSFDQNTPKHIKYLCIAALDKLKQHALNESGKTLSGRRANQWKYEDKIFYIPYYPDEEIQKVFCRVHNKPNMVWDFSISCHRTLKKQIFLILNEIIKMGEASRLRENRLTGLNYLYQYCVERNVSDLERMEQDQILGFNNYLVSKVNNPQKIVKMAGILDFGRKQIFLEGKEIHWYANIWYLERFHFWDEKVNISDPIKRISFLDVSNKENRELLKAYMKYELGVSEDTVSIAIEKFYCIRDFLMELSKQNCSVLECSKLKMQEYLKGLQEKTLAAKTFNAYISRITHFYNVLAVHGYPVKLPFEPAYYMKKEIPVHHDRSVPAQISQEIMGKLRYFPEHLRIMFLHLWGLGLRISEVCAIKGNAYYRQGEDAWIQIYQTKMKQYKRIPIPEALYQIVMVYMKRNDIGPDDFLFQNQEGSAYSSNTFMWQMKKCCEEVQIQNGIYLFRSHDYRHTVATFFYDEHVSMQAIRDYLGHENEEMTRQYIDYMPYKIAKANDEFFQKKGNSLLSMVRERKSHGK